MEWDTVIGLEVHAQLKTNSKLFSGASTAFGASPNTQTCFIDAGLPGVLPVLNQQVVVMAIQFGLAVEADINDGSFFERKNYFYPDLPKGYQISQLQKPIVSNGKINIELKDGTEKTIIIERAHLEEDAGKSLHEMHSTLTGIDLNRAGTPLLEIVTTPCLSSIEETINYLKNLHQLVRFLGICDGNMQEGSFRCDVNFSLKPKGSTTLGTRTEIKNLNSFRFIEKAIAYEQLRHQDLLENNQKIIQETRLYNPDSDTTVAMRSKEEENDYRYFPDPDLLPMEITRYQIAEIKDQLPDLPKKIRLELKKNASLNEEDIHFVLSSPAAYLFYKEIKSIAINAHEKSIINWLKGPYTALLNEHQLSFEDAPVSANNMAQLLDKVADGTLSTNNARRVLNLLWDKEEDINSLIIRENLQTEDNSELEGLVLETIRQHPEQVAEYKAGKEKLLAFFVGQIMKQTKGRGNPEQINLLLKKHLI